MTEETKELVSLKFLSKESQERFVIEAYNRCYDSKHHYDNLSWVIGGILLAGVAVVMAYLPQIKAYIGTDAPLTVVDLVTSKTPTTWYRYLAILPARLSVAFFAVLLLGLWYNVYSRNRIWAEIANQKMRDFERMFHVEGLSIRFMKENNNIREKGVIFLKNLDETDAQLFSDSSESAKYRPLHVYIKWFICFSCAVLLLECIIP